MLPRILLPALCLLAMLAGQPAVSPAMAHEGHDHDNPAPLNLPVAPRVVAVTPELELVGVLSGSGRLTVFLHTFATNAPVKAARMTVSSGANSMDAIPADDGVFSLAAPWLATTEPIDLIFALTMSDGTQDLLTGQLKHVAAARSRTARPTGIAALIEHAAQGSALVAVALVGLAAGSLLTLLVSHRQRRRTLTAGVAIAIAAAWTVSSLPTSVIAAGPDGSRLPSVPATMATDIAQRSPDGTLFVPKATQHLLSVRTILTARGAASRATELTGTIIPGPEHFGRVQPGRPGRIEAADGGLAFIGKRVEKGQVLAYVTTYIEAADRANIDSSIAETEGRIEKLRTIVSRYDKSPGAVPQVKVDEVRGELEALTRKRAELMPSLSSRVPVLSPISGIVSVASATIGQIVDARDVLFEIVDPSQFWVEALGHRHESGTLKELTAAYALMAGGHQIPLEFAGRGLALRHQATVFTFRIVGRHDGLSIGQPAKVILQATAKVDGFILPASAIVRGQTGLPTVWIKSEPERFDPQTVKVEPLDGKSVVVTAGLKANQRVVTDGVTLLNQVR